MNFTLNNHLKYWIGDREFGFREKPIDKFKVQVGQIDYDHYKKSNWYDEQLRTADVISKEFGKDFVVMFSGGTDSEIVLRSFIKIGIKPRCVFISFPGEYDLNVQDLINASTVCNELDLDLEIVEHDVFDFYNSGEAADFAKEIQCRQMAYLNVYYNIKKLGVPAIMGGEMMLRKTVFTNKPAEWYYCFRENEDASAMRFSLKYNIPLVNEWFSYTPEMVAYYLEHPTIVKLVTNQMPYKLSTVSSKNAILSELLPEITIKNKTHGFEKMLGFNKQAYESLYVTHVRKLEESLDGIKIDDLKTMLYGDKNEHN